MKDQRFLIADLIRDQLLAAQNRQLDEQVQYFSSITDELQHVQQIQHRLLLAHQRHFHGAQRQLSGSLERVLRDLSYYIESAQRNLTNELTQVPTHRELFAELDQLQSEFGEWRYDHSAKILSVTTDPITLEGLSLGSFEIRLFLGELDLVQKTHPFQCVALDPHPPGGADNVTHPHVRDDDLCVGDASTSLMDALEAGRICDFFLIIRQVLHTYNSDSPFVSIDLWEGESCHDCGYTMSEDNRFFCEQCQYDFCDDCMSGCRCCDMSFCRNCLKTCPFCDEPICGDCMKTCTGCGKRCCDSCLEDQLCPDCIKSQKEQNHEQDGQQQEDEPTTTHIQAA